MAQGEFQDKTRKLNVLLCEKANNRQGFSVAGFVPGNFKVLKDGATFEMTAAIVVPKKRGQYSLQVQYMEGVQSVAQPNGTIKVSSSNPPMTVLVSTIEAVE